MIVTHNISVRRSRSWTDGATRLGSSTVSSVLAPATLDGPSMYHLSLKLYNRHGCMLVRVQLDESETTIGLHADLRQVSDRLEQRDQVCLGAVRDEVADIDGRVVGGGLLHNRFV